MKIFRFLGLGFGALVCAGIAQVSPAPIAFADAKLGVSVSTLIAAHGSPRVVSTDVGHVWTWETHGRTRVTTDDNGIIRMLDMSPDPADNATFIVPATNPRISVAFQKLTVAQADAGLAALADFKGFGAFPDSGERAEFRAYKISPTIECVLLFDSTTKALSEAFYGERGVLARGGLLPGSGDAVTPRFVAPTIIHQGAIDYPPTRKQGDAFVRIDVDKTGAVSNATIFVSSGDPDLDRVAVLSAKNDQFIPAKLDNTPVSAVVFHKEEFRTAPLVH